MNSTLLVIDSDYFKLECPHCGEHIQEIMITRGMDSIECQECYEEMQVTVQVEPA
jgi:uncharacterized radical SAM superfamily protein